MIVHEVKKSGGTRNASGRYATARDVRYWPLADIPVRDV